PILVVAGLRRCRDHERAEQCKRACDDQRQSAASRRAGISMIADCSLQHRNLQKSPAPIRATIVANNSTKVRPVADATMPTATISLPANAMAGSEHGDVQLATADPRYR